MASDEPRDTSEERVRLLLTILRPVAPLTFHPSVANQYADALMAVLQERDALRAQLVEKDAEIATWKACAHAHGADAERLAAQLVEAEASLAAAREQVTALQAENEALKASREFLLERRR